MIPEFVPKTSEEAVPWMAEECSEVIKQIMKAQRFGMGSNHPDDPKTCNAELILKEMDDLQAAMNLARPYLEDFVKNGKRTPYKELCDGCAGTGFRDAQLSGIKCEYCGGVGRLERGQRQGEKRTDYLRERELQHQAFMAYDPENPDIPLD